MKILMLYSSIFFRLSCSIFIPETSPSQVIVTGGRDPTMKLVLVYKEDGSFDKYLPSLRQGRYNHGCTDYYSGNDRVSLG